MSRGQYTIYFLLSVCFKSLYSENRICKQTFYKNNYYNRSVSPNMQDISVENFTKVFLNLAQTGKSGQNVVKFILAKL
jgi:hypothetical protein